VEERELEEEVWMEGRLPVAGSTVGRVGDGDGVKEDLLTTDAA
jgi:hypothetical protein